MVGKCLRSQRIDFMRVTTPTKAQKVEGSAGDFGERKSSLELAT